MIYQIVQPHPALKPFVKAYMLLHFNFSGLKGDRPAKLLEARAEQSLILYPNSLNNSMMTKVQAHSAERVAVR